MTLSADNPDYIFSLIAFFGIFGFCVAVYLILEVLKFMGITKNGD